MTTQEENESTEEVQDPTKVLAELRRAQADLKSLRKEYKALSTERESLAAQVETLSADEMRTRALGAETKLALQAQGIKDVDRLMKYIGTDGLDFGEDGKVTGLDDRLKSLKSDLPEIFDPKVRAGGRADIFASDSVEVKEDPMRAQVRQALSN